MSDSLSASGSFDTPEMVGNRFGGWATRWAHFKVSFRKWWDGVEDRPKSRRTKTAASDTSAPAAARAWTPERISIAQLIWGDGFTFPGGIDYTLELAKTLCLSKDSTVLDIGCGLGGSARALHKSFGAWVTGMEASEPLAKAGMEISLRAGLERKAPVLPFDTENPNFAPARQNAVLCRDVLTSVVDKTEFLKSVAATLKPGGLILLLDYARMSTMPTPELVAWNDAEGGETLPLFFDEYSHVLHAAGIDVRVCEDVSADFRQRVTAGWEDLATQLATKSLSSTESDELRKEIALWGQRLAALKSGSVSLVRVFGIKQS